MEEQNTFRSGTLTQDEEEHELLRQSKPSSEALKLSSSSSSSSVVVSSPTAGKVISLDYEEEGEGIAQKAKRSGFESNFETNSYGRPRRSSHIQPMYNSERSQSNGKTNRKLSSENLSNTHNDDDIDYIGLSNSSSSEVSSFPSSVSKGAPQKMTIANKPLDEASKSVEVITKDNNEKTNESIATNYLLTDKEEAIVNKDNDNSKNKGNIPIHEDDTKIKIVQDTSNDDKTLSTTESMNPIAKRRRELLIEARKKRIAWIEDGDVMWERENEQNVLNLDLIQTHLDEEGKNSKYAKFSSWNTKEKQKQKKKKKKSIIIEDRENKQEEIGRIFVNNEIMNTTSLSLQKRREKERVLKSKKKRAEANIYTKRVNIAEVIDRSIFGNIPTKTVQKMKMEQLKGYGEQKITPETGSLISEETETKSTTMVDLLDRYMHFLNKIIDPNKPSDAIDVPVVQEDDTFLSNDNPPLPNLNDLQLSLQLSLSLANKNQQQEKLYNEQKEGQNQQVHPSRNQCMASHIYPPFINSAIPIRKSLYFGKTSNDSTIYMPSKNSLIIESLLKYELFITRLKHPAAATLVRSIRTFLDKSIESYIEYERDYQRMKVLKKNEIYFNQRMDNAHWNMEQNQNNSKISALQNPKDQSTLYQERFDRDKDEDEDDDDSEDEEEPHKDDQQKTDLKAAKKLPAFGMAKNIRDFINSMENEIKKTEIFGISFDNQNSKIHQKKNESLQNKNHLSSFVKDCLECFLFSKLCGNIYLPDDSLTHTQFTFSDVSEQKKGGKHSIEENPSIHSIFSPSSNSMIPYILSLSNRSSPHSHNMNMTQCYLLRPDKKIKLWKKDRRLFARLHALSFLTAVNLDVTILTKLATSLRFHNSDSNVQIQNEAVEDCLKGAIACLKGIWSTPTRLHHLISSPYQHEGKYILRLPPTNPLALINTLITCMDLIEEGVERKKSLLYNILVVASLKRKFLLKHFISKLADIDFISHSRSAQVGTYSNEQRRYSMLVGRRQIYSKLFPNEIKKIPTPLGADDIMPLLILVLLRSNVPFLHTLFELIENYRDSSQIFQGRAGYVFTNFSSALQYLSDHLDAHMLVNINEDEFNRKYQERYNCINLNPQYQDRITRLQDLHSFDINMNIDYNGLDSYIDRKLEQLREINLIETNEEVKPRRRSQDKLTLDKESESDSEDEESDSSFDYSSDDGSDVEVRFESNSNLNENYLNDAQIEKIWYKTKKQVQKQLKKLNKQEKKKSRKKRMETFNIIQKKKTLATFLNNLPSDAPANRYWQIISNKQQIPSIHGSIQEVYEHFRHPFSQSSIDREATRSKHDFLSIESLSEIQPSYKESPYDIYRKHRFTVTSELNKTDKVT